MHRKKWVLIFLVILIVFCVTSILVDDAIGAVKEQHRRFVYCSLINRDMTRDEVYDHLSLIGEFEDHFQVDPDYLDLSRIHFVDKNTRFITGGDTIIAYKDGKVLLRYYYTSVSDRHYFCDEEKQELYGAQ